MKIPIKEPIRIEDGTHDGVITAAHYRDTPYDYTDFEIETKVDDRVIKLSASYPTFIAPDSKLGKLLNRFGYVIKIDKPAIDPDELIGKEVSFMTMTEKTDRGTFAKVIPESLKPK